jgi:hypothetical protein
VNFFAKRAKMQKIRAPGHPVLFSTAWGFFWGVGWVRSFIGEWTSFAEVVEL